MLYVVVTSSHTSAEPFHSLCAFLQHTTVVTWSQGLTIRGDPDKSLKLGMHGPEMVIPIWMHCFCSHWSTMQCRTECWSRATCTQKHLQHACKAQRHCLCSTQPGSRNAVGGYAATRRSHCAQWPDAKPIRGPVLLQLRPTAGGCQPAGHRTSPFTSCNKSQPGIKATPG